MRQEGARGVVLVAARRMILPALAVSALACGGGAGSTGGASGGSGGSGVSGATGSAGSGAGMDAGTPTGSDARPGDALPASSAGLRIELPASPPVGLPFPIIVRTADGRPLSARAMVSIGAMQKTLDLHRGRGSVSATIATAGMIVVKVTVDGLSGERTVTVADRPKRMLAGVLADRDLMWDAKADIVLTGNIVVPAAGKLVVEAGTRILGGARANLDVAGTITVNGTEQDPVLFTRGTDMAWGGVRIGPGKSDIHHALFTQGGGDDTRSFGHKIALVDPKFPLPTQPLVLAAGGDVLVAGGGVIDSRGKGPSGTMNGSITIRDYVISRVAQGGETNGAQLIMEGTHVMEIPDSDPQVTSDDADGYHLGPPKKMGTTSLASSIKDSVFTFTEDDGIDHNATDMTIDRVWVENIYHEGIAISEYGNVSVTNSVISHVGQGIEVGWGKPIATVKNVLVAGAGVGLRWGDDYDWEEDGVLKASYVAVLKDALTPGPVYKSDFPNIDGTFWEKKLTVWNFGFKLNGPKPGGIDISCSMVQSPEWDGKQDNVAGALMMDAKGCPEKKNLPGCPDAPVGPTTCWWSR